MARSSGGRPQNEPRVITLPPKQRVNMLLATVAGALFVLVIIVGHDTFVSRSAAGATAAPSQSAQPTAGVSAPPAAGPKGGTKGKGHD